MNPKTPLPTSNNFDASTELIAAITGAFLIMIRATWVSYFVHTKNIQLNTIIFLGTVFQSVITNSFFVGSGNPLSIYFTNYIDLVNNQSYDKSNRLIKKEPFLLNPVRVLFANSRSVLMILIQMVGQTAGVLLANSVIFYYSPLAKHNDLYHESFNYENSINSKHTMLSATFYETMAIFLIMLSSTTIKKIFTNLQGQELTVMLIESSIVATLVVWTVPETGAQLNPALAFGMNFSYLLHSGANLPVELFRHFVVFWFFPIFMTHFYAYFYVKNSQYKQVKKQINHGKMVKKIQRNVSEIQINQKIKFDKLYL